MIMHIWMHWFWITTSYFKAFLFFTAQTISFSCIPQAVIAEAGLLENHTFTTVIPKYYKGDDSSQLGEEEPRVSSPNVTEGGNRSSETTPRHPGPREDPVTEESATPKSEDARRTASGSTVDLQDTYNGETLDVFQYPLKKYLKYSHLKYGKVKAKGKPSNDTGGDETKLDAQKVAAESADGSASAVEHSETEVDVKANDGLSAGSTTELPTSDAPDVMFTTAEEGLGDSPPTPGNASAGNTSAGNPSLNSSTVEVSQESGSPGEDQKTLQTLRNETLVIENKVEDRGPYTTEEPSAMKNRVAASTSAQNYEVRESDLNVGSITGITLGILVVFTLFGAVSFVLYRRRYLNKPQVLHDKCSNLDSSGYIDETSLRENSEEMYSLDNDSFLNSLEAMTIQNYWTENVKHTKL